jgi:hypothetical protein
MQERKKKKIVLASVLKPVDDTRMFEKMGISLAEAGYEVHIIGFPSKTVPTHPSIQFHASSFFTRISVGRIVAGYFIFRKCLAVQPDLVIVGTHELLGYALLTKLFTRSKIIYDIQENHFYNIRYTSTFPKIVRLPFAFFVRIKEQLIVPFIDHFALAEKGYETELSFLPDRKTTLENKFRKSLVKQTSKQAGYTKLVFTGTIAKTTGIFEVIHFVKKLHQVDSSFTLTIIGYAAQKNVLNKVMVAIQEFPFIRLIGGDSLVPHAEIIGEISKADFGFIWYPQNRSTATSVPTKFYEYTALGLSILIPEDQSIAHITKVHGSGIVFNPEADVTILLENMKTFLPSLEQPATFYWESEETKLLSLLTDTADAS